MNLPLEDLSRGIERLGPVEALGQIDGATPQEASYPGKILPQWEIIIYPSEQTAHPRTTQQPVEQRRLFTLLAIEIVNDPITERPFGTNKAGSAIDVSMFSYD